MRSAEYFSREMQQNALNIYSYDDNIIVTKN